MSPISWSAFIAEVLLVLVDLVDLVPPQRSIATNELIRSRRHLERDLVVMSTAVSAG